MAGMQVIVNMVLLINVLFTTLKNVMLCDATVK